ncbi:MAG: hypothetical protein O8C64_14675 [Candidatus Methanoperedens sp.]|nr:hypothetical protein [Candidatus Methanoperedens sp.]MCZ7404025.1 hypothetical protein [Candidatus Methanoperedens sp.]
MKSRQGISSCWHNKLQGALFLSAFLTWGLGDAVTSLWMIEHRGITGEANLIAQYIIINYGASSFIAMKIWFTTIVLFFVPFLLQKRSQEPVYWMINGYYLSFFIAGALAMILNMQAAQNEALLLSPEQVIFLFLSLIFILTSVGEEVDKRTNPMLENYFDCFLYDITKILTFITNRN